MLVSLAWLVYIYTKKKLLIFSCHACLALVFSEQRTRNTAVSSVTWCATTPFLPGPLPTKFPLDFPPCPAHYVTHSNLHRCCAPCVVAVTGQCTSVCVSVPHIIFFSRLFGAMRQRHLLLHLLDKKEATYALCIRISFNEHRLTSFPG